MVSHHKPPHSLFLNTLILFLLLPFSIGMVGCHSFGQFLNFSCDGPVVLFEVFGMLKDAVKVLLNLEWEDREKRRERAVNQN